MTPFNYTPDPHKKAQLSEEQSSRLDELSDEDIDYSDIPELDDDFWENAQRVNNDVTQNSENSLKELLLAMPDVEEDYDFNNVRGYG